MRKPYQLPGWTKNSSDDPTIIEYSAPGPAGDRTHDLPPGLTSRRLSTKIHNLPPEGTDCAVCSQN